MPRAGPSDHRDDTLHRSLLLVGISRLGERMTPADPRLSRTASSGLRRPLPTLAASRHSLERELRRPEPNSNQFSTHGIVLVGGSSSPDSAPPTHTSAGTPRSRHSRTQQ